MDRRDFLKAGFIGGLGLIAAPLIAKLPKEKDKPKTEEWLEKSTVSDNNLSVDRTVSAGDSLTAERWNDVIIDLGNLKRAPLIIDYNNETIDVYKMAKRLKELENKVWG